MADKTYNIIKSGQGKTVTNLKKHITLEVTSIDDTDTITVDELTTVDSATVIDLEDAVEYATTLATNVITMNDVACVSDHVIVLVVGVSS